MGLDMHIFKVRKLTDTEVHSIVCQDVQEIVERDLFTVLLDSALQQYPSLYQDLRPYLTLVKLQAEFIDLDKIKTIKGLSKDALFYNRIITDDYCDISFMTPDDAINCVRLSVKELQDFLFKKEDLYYVVKMTEYAYWSKNNELRGAIHKYYKDAKNTVIENSGYYAVDNTLQRIIKSYDNNYDISKEDLVYYEWY